MRLLRLFFGKMRLYYKVNKVYTIGVEKNEKQKKKCSKKNYSTYVSLWNPVHRSVGSNTGFRGCNMWNGRMEYWRKTLI